MATLGGVTGGSLKERAHKEVEMKPMQVGGAVGSGESPRSGDQETGAVWGNTGVNYHMGGREYTYAGPGEHFDGPWWCEWVISTCAPCGLDRAQRQLWSSALTGPIVNLVKVNVGGGILAIPLTFKLCGALPATFMLVFFGSMSHYSSVLLADVGEMTGCATLESASSRLLGYWGGRFLQVCMLLKCFGSLVAYLIVMGNVFPPLLCYHITPAESPSLAMAAESETVNDCTVDSAGGLQMRTVVLLSIALFVLAPLSMLRSVNSLRFGSMICLVLVALLIVQMIWTAAITSTSSVPAVSAGGKYSGWLHGVQTKGHTEALLRSLGILVFAFTCQHMVFPIYAELHSASTSLFSLVSRLTFVSVAVIYWTMGASGFASFGGEVHADVLQNLGGDNPSTYVNALKVGFTSTLVFSYQFNIFAARPSLDALLFSAVEDSTYSQRAATEQEGGPCATPTSWPRFVAEGWICVAFSAGMAVVVPDLDMALALTGSSTCTIIAFIYPALLFVIAVRDPSLKSDSHMAATSGHREVMMAAAVGVAGCIFGTIATFAILQHGGTAHGR